MFAASTMKYAFLWECSYLLIQFLLHRPFSVWSTPWKETPMIQFMEVKKKKAVVVGGSIAGLSCAHALLAAGWQVTVIEKSISPPEASPTGAGLSLEPQARKIIDRWLSDPAILHDISLPLSIELHQAIDSERKTRRTLTRDENFPYRCVHWTDLHSIIHKALPSNIVLWGHRFLSLCISDDKSLVTIKARALKANEVVEIVGDLLVAADGSQSMIRQHFLPNHKLRYSGYSAWRGVFDFPPEDELSNTMAGIRRAYPELGNCLYLDLAKKTHCPLFELRNRRVNWIWYFNTPEPDIKGMSVTIKVSNDMITRMHEEAEKVWTPELVQLMKETKEPFINVIYDSDPLPQLFWDNVVLVGDAAHPTTPHASRSTNMSILDAEVLGLCLKKWGSENLLMALQEYQSIRHPVVSEQVLHSRKLGRLKQGLPLHDGKTFDPNTSSQDECEGLQHRTTPFFELVPFSNISPKL